MRNHLAALAVVFRLVTLWAFLSTAHCRYVSSDLYWGSRQADPEYAAFKSVLEEVQLVRDTLGRGGELDDASAQELAARMHEVDHELDYWIGLFTADVVRSSESPCSAFRTASGRLFVLKSQEQVKDTYWCDYSEFAY